MPSLAETSLTALERRALERFLALLQDELGASLIAVRLFGSRSRGERPDDWTDVDLLVVTQGGEADRERVWRLTHEAVQGMGAAAPDLSPVLESPESLARARERGAFLLREIVRDGVPLVGGELPELADLASHAPGRGSHGLMSRTQEYLDQARYLLGAARELVDGEHPGVAVAESYFAVLNAARAALSERDVFARTHRGTWDRLHAELIDTGELDWGFERFARELQGKRDAVHYKARRYGPEDARAAYAAAERFVRAVGELLGADA